MPRKRKPEPTPEEVAAKKKADAEMVRIATEFNRNVLEPRRREREARRDERVTRREHSMADVRIAERAVVDAAVNALGQERLGAALTEAVAALVIARAHDKQVAADVAREIEAEKES